MKFAILCLVGTVLSSPIEIINYEDPEAGHGHMMSGEPGVMVDGSYYWKAPETGDSLKLVYSAGEQGYIAQGDHLPVAPEVPAAPRMELPVMVVDTQEVSKAREAFFRMYDAAKVRAEEAMAMSEVAGNGVEAVERRRRDADPVVPGSFIGQYAPAYPHYYVYPAAQKVVERKEMETEDSEMKVMDDMEMEEVSAKTVQYAPAYHYNPVYYPISSYPTTTVTQRVLGVSAPYYPNLLLNPVNRLYPSVVPQSQFVYPQGVVQTVQTAPVVSQPQQVQKFQGEDEAAALAL